MTGPGLTLERGNWYAWQMLPGYGSGFHPYFSLIKMWRVRPEKTGASILGLAFLNAFYAAGVQGFSVRLRVTSRREHYLVGELLYDTQETERCAVIGRLSHEWLADHCSQVLERHPESRHRLSTTRHLNEYLDRIFHLA